MKAEPETNMNKFTAALLALPLFAIACGSSPTTAADTDTSTARASLALGENEEPAQEEVTLEAEEPESFALTEGDADAPAPAPEQTPVSDAGAAPQEETSEEPVVGDAGAPVAPEAAPYSGPCPEGYPDCTHAPECTENETRRRAAPEERYIETCMGGEWSLCLSHSCPVPIYWDANGFAQRVDGL